MTDYTNIIDRSNANSRTAREIPESVANEILSDAVEGSAALALGNVFRMPAYQHRIPVLKTFADAYWQNGNSQAEKDSAQKKTTSLLWDNVYLTPEELAVLVPIPDAWMADSNIAWGEVRREVGRAFAKAIDEAIFFGAGATLPSTFGNGVVPDAIAAGNWIVPGSVDLADDIAALGQLLEEDGYDATGFVAKKGFHWQLTRLRSSQKEPIFQTDFSSGSAVRSLYGQAYREVGNGSWDTDVKVLAGEWDKLRIGVRQDMTFDLFDQAVITDGSGNVVYNAVQQDGKVLRAVMRLGYAVPNPVKVLGGTYPFAILGAAGTPGS
jgi:HK97 family phage major capsid protein